MNNIGNNTYFNPPEVSRYRILLNIPDISSNLNNARELRSVPKSGSIFEPKLIRWIETI